MYNNFLSKKSKKAISALLASALVITAAPISADAATTKIIGVGKSKTVSVSASAKVTKLSKAEQKIVKITKKGKKFTIKGLKAGKATFKIGSKSFTVKVGATAVKKKNTTLSFSMTAGKSKVLKVTAANGKKDTLKWVSSNKKVLTVANTTSVANAKLVAKNTIKAVKAGSANITVTSKVTGKSKTFKVTVKAASVAPATTAPATTAPAATTGAAVTDAPTTTAPATTTGAAVTEAPEPTSTVSGGATEAPEPTSTVSGGATEAPDVTTGPATTETPDVDVVTAEAVSASAVNTKTLAVEFNRDLTDDEKADVLKVGNVVVTNNNVTQNTKAAFENASTLYITTSTSTNFAAGTYTIKLNGDIQFEKDVVVEAADVQSIEIKSTTVEATTAGAIKIDLLDQYGDNVAFTSADISVTAINKTDSTRGITSSIANGVLTLNTTAAKIDDEIILTVVYNKKGLTDTKTIKVVAEDYVNTLTLGTPASADSRITAATTDTRIEYTATKFYGDATAITLGSDGDYTVISSDTTVVLASNVGVTTGTDNKQYITITRFEGAGTATLVFVNNKTGATVNVVITVLPAAGVATSATLENNEVTVAAGSTAYVGITVKDNYDEEILADKFEIDTTSSDANVKLSLEADKNNANFNKIKVDATDATSGTVVGTISIKGSTTIAPIVLTVKVGEAAKPQSITAKADADTLLVGGTTDIKVTAIDQYNGEFNVGSSDTYTLEATVAEPAVATVTQNGGTFTVTAVKAGSTTVTIVVKQNGNQILATEVRITVEANDSTNYDYAVDDIVALNPTGSAVSASGEISVANNKYAQKITVKATKKTDGSVLEVPSSQILSITSSDDKIVKVEKTDDGWYVYGNSSKALEADTTANLKVIILTSGEPVTIEKTVTVSKDVPYVETMALYVTSAYKVKTTTLNVASSGALTGGAVVNLATTDQYGVTEKVMSVANVTGSAATSVTISEPDGVEGYTNPRIEGGELKFDNIKVTKANATFKVTIVVDGVVAQFKVTVTNADA